MRNKFDTFYLNEKSLNKEWLLVDAENQTLGRLASQIAAILRGKHKATFQPSMDNGDFVVVINADKVKVTGNKFEDKQYFSYTGFPGGITERSFAQMQSQKPQEVIELAVKRMLPKGRIGRAMYKKLFVYSGAEHTHAAQKPRKIEF